MWVAKDKDGEVHLFYNKPHRDNVFGSNSWTIDVPEEIKEYTKGWEHYDAIIGYWMKVNSEDYPNLKWEDEPIEVKLTEIYHFTKTCSKCNKESSYTHEDIETTWYCPQPSSGYEEEVNFVICSHCKERIYL